MPNLSFPYAHAHTQYAILLAVIITIVIKYLLHRYDLEQRDVPWENKGVYLLYFELLVGLYKVILYVSFIVVMARIHSFPLFAVRPMYLSLKAFQKALNDVILSRRAIRNMNTYYPDATPEELASVDNVCIICREEMIGNGTAKKLPCNHIFHVSCLRSWFQRQQTCPTCRMNILDQSANNRQQPANNANGNAANAAAGTAAQPAAGAPANQPPGNQQQQQQPGAPQINAGNLRFMFGLNLADNFADLILQQERQQRPAAANQRATSAQQSNGSGQQAGANRTGSTTRITNATVLPPFMGFSFMPFLPFPPAAAAASAGQSTNSEATQPNLGQLSEEELRTLEGNERAALEARIRLLQNLRTSIDAIVLQFQQYNQLVITANQPNQMPQPRPGNATDANGSNSSANSSNRSNTPTESAATAGRSCTGEVKKEKQDGAESGDELKELAKKVRTEGGQTKIDPTKHEPAKDSPSRDGSSDERSKLLLNDNLVDGEVRQLRLRKFIANNESATSSDSDGGGLAKGEEPKKD